MDQEWFSVVFRVYRDTRDPNFVFDLSLPTSVELLLLADVLRDYALKFKIKDERALMDLREYLKEAISDRDCYRELANTLIKDIEEMCSAHESKLTTFRAELDQRGLAPPSIEVECIQLRSQVTSLEDVLVDLSQRSAALNHSWNKERAALEADKVERMF